MAIRDYANSIHAMDGQIARMDARLAELKEQAGTNEQAGLNQRREITRLLSTSEGLTNEIAEYTPSKRSSRRPVAASRSRTTPSRNSWRKGMISLPSTTTA